MSRPILLLGATGRTGRLVLHQALDRGYAVHALVRDTTRVEQQNGLKLFEGTPYNAADMLRASKGCGTIINVLNISRTSDVPWAPLRTPTDFLSKAMEHCISVFRANNMEHLLLCSAWGVGNSWSALPFWLQWTIRYSNIRYAYRAHAEQEELLQDSGLAWTILRPTGLLDAKRLRPIVYVTDPKTRPRLLVGRIDVAHAFMECLGDERTIGKTFTVSRR